MASEAILKQKQGVIDEIKDPFYNNLCLLNIIAHYLVLVSNKKHLRNTIKFDILYLSKKKKYYYQKKKGYNKYCL